MNTRFLCFIVLFLSFPSYGSNSLIDIGDEKEGYQTPTSHLQSPNLSVSRPPLQEVFDYTKKIGKQVDHMLDEDDIQDMQGSLKDGLFLVESRLENKKNMSFLGAVLQNKKEGNYYRYLFFDADFTKEQEAIKKAHSKKVAYHLIKGQENPHLILQLFGWLHLTKQYTLKALHPNFPVCRKCHLFVFHLFKIRLLTNEKGCLALPFPSSDKMPQSAMNYINPRLTLSLAEKITIPMGHVNDNKVETLKKLVKKQNNKIANLNKQLQQKDAELKTKDDWIINLGKQFEEENKPSFSQEREEKFKNLLKNQHNKIMSLDSQLQQKDAELKSKDDWIDELGKLLQQTKNKLSAKDHEVFSLQVELTKKNDKIALLENKAPFKKKPLGNKRKYPAHINTQKMRGGKCI